MKYILIHVKATRLIQSSAVSDFLFFFIVWLTVMKQTVAGLLSCFHFKIECTDPIYWYSSDIE